MLSLAEDAVSLPPSISSHLPPPEGEGAVATTIPAISTHCMIRVHPAQGRLVQQVAGQDHARRVAFGAVAGDFDGAAGGR
jgi:hypothetical protein